MFPAALFPHSLFPREIFGADGYGGAGILYHIYADAGDGLAPDYTTPIDTVPGLTWHSAPLGAGQTHDLAVRAFNASSGLEELNIDAVVRIVLDASGYDVSLRPAPPTGLSVTPGANGTAVVHWVVNPSILSAPPTGFRVYLGTPTPNYAAPAATVPWGYASPFRLQSALSGLSDGVTYQAAVRAFNATGEEPNAIAYSFTASSVGPDPVDSLTAVPTFDESQ